MGRVLLGQRRQAPHHHAGRPPGHPLDDAASSGCGSRISITGASNQFITQRTLAAKSLKQGQLGIIFAALPEAPHSLRHHHPRDHFLAAFPGPTHGPGATTDQAYPLLIRNLVGPGLRGFILAAIAGAVISTLGSLLNSVATLLTMDVYKRHIKKDADGESLVRIGRWATVVFVVAVCLIAPQLGNPKFKGIFNYIQEFQGFISPGILAAFLFGLFVKKTPRSAGMIAASPERPDLRHS